MGRERRRGPAHGGVLGALVKSFLYGALLGLVYVPIYNALERRFGS